MDPRLDLIGQLGPIAAWVVDGDKIRDEIDPDFTNFGQHYRFDFVPANEFWLDKENEPGEQQFFIDHLRVEHRLMSQGIGYEDALGQADRVEKAERAKSARVKSRVDAPDQTEVKLELLASDGDVEVWLVDGELVRDYFDVDFTEGGHGYIYDWIPFSEIWIDNDASEYERSFVTLHEARERILMRQGATYDEAHQQALQAEMRARHESTSLIQRVLAGEDVDELMKELTTAGAVQGLPAPMLVKDKKDGTTKPGYPYVKTTHKDAESRLDPNNHESIQGVGIGGNGSLSNYHTSPWTFGAGGARRNGLTKDVGAATAGGANQPDDMSGAQPPADWPKQWVDGTKKLNVAYNKEESMIANLIDQVLEGCDPVDVLIESIGEASSWIKTEYTSIKQALKASVMAGPQKRNWRVEKQTANYALLWSAWGPGKEMRMREPGGYTSYVTYTKHRVVGPGGSPTVWVRNLNAGDSPEGA